MQVISLVHNCLYFKQNGRKYLFGLTNTLFQDKSALKKLKVEFVILPSLFYNMELNLYMWQLSILQILGCEQIIIEDNYTRKRVQGLLQKKGYNQLQRIKWQLLAQHDLKEQVLFQALTAQIQAKRDKNILAKQPFGWGFNQNKQLLKCIVCEQGRTLLLLHESDIIVVDPGQNIARVFQLYGLPLSAIRGVLLTSAWSLNIFELMLKLPTVTVITQQEVYLKLKNRLHDYACMSAQMIRSKLKGKIIRQQMKTHSFCGIDFSVKKNKVNQTVYWQIVFGLQKIRLYPGLLDIFPQEIVKEPALNLLILYQIEENIKKKLQQIPMAYRKKIIFNRVSRKYNNKYFMTLNKTQQIATVEVHQFAKSQIQKRIQQPSIQFKESDQHGRLIKKQLKNNQKFNAKGRVFYALKGYLTDSNQKIYFAGDTIKNTNFIQSQGGCMVMYQTDSNNYFYHGWQQLSQQFFCKNEDLLKKVKENSFVANLKRYKNKQYQQSQDLLEIGSQWQVLNSICKVQTYQTGQQIIEVKALYLIVKGGMKYRSSEAIADKMMGIGNIKGYFCSSVYLGLQTIDIVKDTVALKIDLESLHSIFFVRFAQKMYQLFTQGLIFD